MGLRTRVTRARVALAAFPEHAWDAAKGERDVGEGNHLILGDGWAQWAMALTGLLALILSAWAVWLLKRTLDATRAAVKSADDAVEVTRELGEAQIRAYLSCRSAKYKFDKNGVFASVEIANTGQSPASAVSIAGTVSIYVVGGRPAMPRVLEWWSSSENEVRSQPIVSGGTTTEDLPFFWEIDFKSEEIGDDAEFTNHVVAEGNEIRFDLVIKWSDVFSKQHEFTVELYAVTGPSPYSPRKGRSKAGRLDFRMEDARHRVRHEPGSEAEGQSPDIHD